MDLNLLWLAVIIQMVFFIVNDAHYAILLFIALSFIIRYFSNNQLFYILIPMVICQFVYSLYHPVLSSKLEFFRRRRRRRGKRRIGKRRIGKAMKKTKKIIKKRAKKGIKGNFRDARRFTRNLADLQKKNKKQETTISSQNAQLMQKDGLIRQQKASISLKDGQLAEHRGIIQAVNRTAKK